MKADLDKSEVVLVGRWIYQNGQVEEDDTAKRIDFLVENHLRRLCASDDGWRVLLIDDRDGRYWELSYPDSASHGGGAPKLEVLSEALVRAKYQL